MTRVVWLAALLLAWAGVVRAQPVPERVVSADGAVTEFVYALGQGERLVGVDTPSRYPEAVGRLPKVGYLRALPFEGVLALRPDLLLTTEEAAPERNLMRLENAGVRVVRLPVAWTLAQVRERIRRIGQTLAAEPEAERLIQNFDVRLQAVEADIRHRGASPRVLFLLVAGSHQLMVAGANTAADALLDILGADNAAGAMEGYKPASREALIATRPDAIVVAEASAGQFRVSDWPELALLDAWQRERVYVGDSMFLLGFGPRLPEALEAVNAVLAP